jgi:hypothetical protein
VLTESKVDLIPPVTASATDTAVATIEEYRQRIWSSCKKTVEDLLDLGAVCRDAADGLSNPEIETLLQSDMPFNESTFWKYVKIGRDQRLPGIAASLPPRLTTIYEMTHLTDEQFEEAVALQKIHPKVRREDVAALRKPSGSGAGGKDDQREKPDAERTATELKAGGRYELKVPEGAGEDDCKRITKALGKLSVKFKVEIGPIEEPETVPAAAPDSAIPFGSITSRVKQASKKLKGSTSLVSAAEK